MAGPVLLTAMDARISYRDMPSYRYLGPCALTLLMYAMLYQTGFANDRSGKI